MVGTTNGRRSVADVFLLPIVGQTTVSNLYYVCMMLIILWRVGKLSSNQSTGFQTATRITFKIANPDAGDKPTGKLFKPEHHVQYGSLRSRPCCAAKELLTLSSVFQDSARPPSSPPSLHSLTERSRRVFKHVSSQITARDDRRLASPSHNEGL